MASLTKINYQKTTWTASAPITADLMNNIEDGIKKLDNQYSALKETETIAAKAKEDIQSHTNSINGLDGRVGNLENSMTEANNAVNQIKAATVNNDPAYANLDTRFTAIENKVNEESILRNANSVSINGAQRNTNDSLKQRFEDAEAEIEGVKADVSDKFDTLSGAYNTLNQTIINSSGGYNSLMERLNSDESQIAANRTELDDAHRSAALNKTFDSIDLRFEGIEGEIKAARGNQADLDTRLDNIDNSIDVLNNGINTLTENKINKSDIVNNLNATVSGGVLDAVQGKALNDHIISVEANVNTIAEELAMVDGNAIKNTNTRIDSLDERLTGLDDSETGRMKIAEDAIDALEANLGSGFNSTDTVAKKITDAISTAAVDATTKANAAETNAKNYADTGLALKANTSDMTSALAGKADNTTVNAISTTIVKAKNEVAYTNEVPSNTQTWTIEDKNDYLLQAEDDKYYYWKHINNEWHLMGGAGGGTGNSSGAFAASLSAIQTPDVNTDYFVGNNTDGYLHYRFIEQSGSDTLQPVLIGVDSTKLKTYNMIKTVEGTESEPINYLDLYEFNYGETNVIRDDDLPPIEQRIAHIVLPQGGGGGAQASNTKLIRIAPTSITTIFNGEGIFLRFFYSCYDNSGEPYEGTYSLRNSNNIELLHDTVNSGASNEVISGWPSNKADGIKYNDGYVSINVEPYCRLGMNTFNLVMTTGTNETLYRQYTVDIKELRLESSAPETLITNTNATAELPYTPFGALEKYLHVFIDNTEIDSVRLSATNTGNELIYTIPAQAQGHHKIKFYLSTEINGQPKTTDPPIMRDYIWRDSAAENVTILASSYRDEIKKVTQYDEVEIPYTLYSTDSSVLVEYYYDYDPDKENTPFSSAILQNTNNGILRYNANDAGDHSLTIKANNEIITIGLDVEDLPIDIAPVSGAIIDFNPALLTNTSVGREPEWVVNKGQSNEKTYKLSVSDNFNWSTTPEDSGGGYREDEDGKCFVIRAGDYATLNYKMFTQNNVVTDGITTTTSKVFDQGAEMKIIFKVSAVRDAKAVWFTNMGKYVATSDKQVGIQLSAHEGYLQTDKATTETIKVTNEEGYTSWESNHTYSPGDIVVVKGKTIYECIKETSNSVFDDDEEKKWRKLGQLETEVGATNSYLYFPYSEDDKIELDININRTGNHEDFIMSYEDGVPSKAYPYDYAAGGDILYQVLGEESNIRIGSPDCDVYIYRIKIYDNALSTNQILKNFIADGKNITERRDRYNRNSIYYDSTTDNFTPYASSTAILDPIQLAKQLPDVKILMLETPRFTTGKKDFVRGTLRCIQAEGGKVYPATDEDNWFFFNGYHAGQGTTSDNYGQSARNVDFLFECDGVHYPTKKKNLTDFEKNWKSAVIHGNEGSVYRDLRDPTNPDDNSVIRGQWESASDAVFDVCDDWMGDKCKVSLTHDVDSGEDTSIPNNYFNLKVNVASSENVNNALFQKRYNDFLPYTSPAKQRDSRIKNGMEFVPAILFIRETGDGTHSEFDDKNWHFYALGNIGDSKKSDYTRAYDPTDMNEFTIEISDNNTANSQFQSGVYKNASTNNVETIETSATETDPMDYVYPITSEQWNAKDENDEYINYRHKTLSTEDFDGDHSFEFRYACCGDYRDGDLINDTHGDSTVPNPNPEEVNDKPYLTKDDVQFDLNRRVWEAFYEWVVTADNTQFRNEASLWIVPEAMEFFYAFTHYYTMMDNRAKNTFWHFAQTGEWKKVPIGRAVPALFHIYEIDDGNGGHRPIEATETFDNTKQYWTQYAFDLWIYDTDTACGIDNNGELVFPYGKEDLDYRKENDPQSGWAFNGSGSIFWRRLSTTFADGITTVMRQSAVECFSDAQDLINQFDKFQECYPEEIWRLDIQRKYIRTFTGGKYDNSITTGKQNIRFLKAMMQGRKKYQRRQWVRDQSIYFGSKYFLNNVGTDTHTIEFNTYTPSTTDGVSTLAVPVDREHVIVVPYQDMYINVAVGNSTTNIADRVINDQYAKRAKAGERVTIDCRSGGSAQETRVYIYGAEHIAAIENLAPAYTYSGSFGQGIRLKSLDLGSDNPDYNNPRFTSISINARMPILESFSVKNCNALGGTINLSQSNNLRVFEAEGSAITGVSLPNYTHIQTLHLPATVTNLTLSSARYLTDFFVHNDAGEIDYTSLINLNINDSDYSNTINWLTIANAALSGNLDTLYLQRLFTSSIEDISDLEPLAIRKKDVEIHYDAQNNLIQKIVLSGTIHVTGYWSEIEKEHYQTVWPGLNLDTTNGTLQVKHKVTYRYNGQIKEIYVNDGAAAPDIYADGTIDMPTQASTAKYRYQFGERDTRQGNYIAYSGWKRSTDNAPLTSAPVIYSDTILDAYFKGILRQYQVRWFVKKNQLVATSNTTISYGGGENLEAPTIKDIHEKGYETCSVTNNNGMITYEIFKGWDKLPVNIEPDGSTDTFDIYGVWEGTTDSIGNIFADTTNLTPQQLLALSVLTDNERTTYELDNKIDVSTSLTCQLGQDNIMEKYVSDTIVSDAGTPLYLNGSDSSISTIYQPLLAGSDAFTFAIDFALEDAGYSSNKPYVIIASCYYSANGVINGFGIFKNLSTNNIEVGFGDMYHASSQRVAISNNTTSTMRNIVVLRHPKGDPKLYIYSGLNAGTNTTNDFPLEAPFDTSITRNGSSEFNSGAVLNIGQLIGNGESIQSTDDISNKWTRAVGTIYWAKYWKADLGIGECKRLAMWPHEKLTLAIAQLRRSEETYNQSRAQDNITPTPTMYLATRNNLLHGFVTQTRVNTNSIKGLQDSKYHWGLSAVRTLCNNRLLYSLPTELQSILCKPAVYSRRVEYISNSQGDEIKLTQNTEITRDYLMAYSIKDLSTTTDYRFEIPPSLPENSPLESQPFAWRIGENVNAYDFNSSNSSWVQNSNTEDGRAQYCNLRFPAIPLGIKIRVFRNIEKVSITEPIVNLIGQSNIKEGDIYIEGTNAYIYVSNKTINDLGLGYRLVSYDSMNRFKGITDNEATAIPSTSDGEGGWIQAENYWTRSLIDPPNTYTIFADVEPNGNVNTNTIATSNSFKVNYILAI